MIIKFILFILCIAILYSLLKKVPVLAQVLSSIFGSFLIGLSILMIANIVLKFKGQALPINIVSIFITGFLGIPGAGALYVLCLIFDCI